MELRGKTILDQLKTQKKIETIYQIVGLNIQEHTYKQYVALEARGQYDTFIRALQRLPRAVSSLGSGQPWLLFWITHGLELLKVEMNTQIADLILDYIEACRCPSSRVFTGGPFQLPHLASNYAATMTCMIINNERAFNMLDREATHRFIVSMRSQEHPGGYLMHDNGECDMRAVYCAICVSSLLNILDDNITDEVAEHIGRCQTYEGGISALPYGEAHGGFTYCALATLAFLNRWDAIDIEQVTYWLVQRQMAVEGGFNGRTNKLVDSCYSFWVGACFDILKNRLIIPKEVRIYDNLALQYYVIISCQTEHGFIDRPGSTPDYYHSCYSLAGLSLSRVTNGRFESAFRQDEFELEENDELFNVARKKIEAAKKYFVGLNAIVQFQLEKLIRIQKFVKRDSRHKDVKKTCKSTLSYDNIEKHHLYTYLTFDLKDFSSFQSQLYQLNKQLQHFNIERALL